MWQGFSEDFAVARRPVMHRVTRLSPVLAVSDLDAAVAFYRDQLGFSLAWIAGTRAAVFLDDTEIQLDSPGAFASAGAAVIHCQMIGVDLYYAECRARGVAFALELAERQPGMIDFSVVDPDGNRISFGSRTVALVPSEA
jgi:catechol 2,3-dioxygenase-like lactoylglutathione lyase family enzyme